MNTTLKHDTASFPSVKSAADRRAEVVRLHYSGMPQVEIAERLGVSRQRIHQILKVEIGDTTPIKNREDFQRSLAVAFFQDILRGKDPKDIAESLDLNEAQTQKILRQELGMTLHQARYYQWSASLIGKRFNDWTILSVNPISDVSPRRSVSLSNARCESCGGLFSVQTINIVRSSSRSCLSCSVKKRKRQQPLLDTRTGDYYVTAQEACASLGITRNQLSHLLTKGVMKRI